MKYHQYKFKFYLNASHLIYLNGVSGQQHPHTWELTLNTLKVTDGFIQFNDVEHAIEELLERFQNQLINDIEPFDIVNPTLENICEYFKVEIQKMLYNNGWLLTTIEISETPARSYLIDVIDEFDFDAVENANVDDEQSLINKMAEEKVEDIISQITQN